MAMHTEAVFVMQIIIVQYDEPFVLCSLGRFATMSCSTFRCALLCISARAISLSAEMKKKPSLLHLMQITIENNITNAAFFFVHRNQIASSSDVGGSCYTCDHGEGRKLQFLQFKILLLFFVSIVEILNFIAICGRTGKLFSASSMHPMISLLFFSGDYHFCILLSDSFIGIYAVFCLHPWYRLAFNSFVFFISVISGQFLAAQLWIVDSVTRLAFLPMFFVTICWLRTRTFVIVSLVNGTAM